MARAATASAGQRLTVSSALVTAEPLTLSCWVNPTSFAATYVWMSVGVSGSNDDQFLLFSDSGTGTVSARKTANAGSGTATAGALTTGAWQHIGGVFTNSSSRAAFRDGGNKGTDTTAVTFVGTLDRSGLLHNARSSQDNVANGAVAHAAAWNAALTDDEMAMLGDGFSPLMVRPQSLMAYWPVHGNDSPEPDLWKGTFPLTIGGSLSKVDAPSRILMPTGVIG